MSQKESACPDQKFDLDQERRALCVWISCSALPLAHQGESKGILRMYLVYCNGAVRLACDAAFFCLHRKVLRIPHEIPSFW